MAMAQISGEEGDSRLSQALSHLHAGRCVAALDALLDAWRACRAGEIADLIDEVSHEIDRSLSPITGTENKLHETWVDMAAKRHPADVGRLPAVIEKCGLVRLRQRFTLIQTLPVDPRMVAKLLRTAGGLRISAAHPLWSMALAVCVQANDVRALAILDELSTVVLVLRPTDSFDVVSLRRPAPAANADEWPCARVDLFSWIERPPATAREPSHVERARFAGRGCALATCTRLFAPCRTCCGSCGRRGLCLVYATTLARGGLGSAR